MKKGDIIRVVNKSGLAIGRWYQIHSIKNKSVYVVNNITIKPFRLSQTTVIKVYTKMAVQVSADDYNKLDKHYTSTYYHPISPRYEQLYDKQPEIIEFYCPGKKRRIYLRVDVICRRYINFKPCIRMYFVERIFKPLFE